MKKGGSKQTIRMQIPRVFCQKWEKEFFKTNIRLGRGSKQ